MTFHRAAIVLVIALLIVSRPPASMSAQNYQSSPELEALHVPLDALLESHVRDGLVYYRALQGERARLSRYVASLNAPAVASEYPSWDRARQKAFWINAYNAFVLQAVVNNYPIRGQAQAYPSNSIRQIPGAFERAQHSAAGRNVTLDQIENTILAEFKDPRVFLALGRGAIGSGRLRSEAYAGKTLDRQLDQARQQFAITPRWTKVDSLAGRVGISPIVSWRSQAFIAEYADDAFDLPKRETIELAVIGFLRPHLLDAEVEFIQKNSFQLTYLPFDWRLNDLTNGRPD
jgi:hypothetical protein